MQFLNISIYIFRGDQFCFGEGDFLFLSGGVYHRFFRIGFFLDLWVTLIR